MDAFSPILYGSKLNARRKTPFDEDSTRPGVQAMPGVRAGKPPILRGVPPGKAAPPPRYNLANLIADRAALQKRLDLVMDNRERGGVPAGARVFESQIRTLDEQINAANAPAQRAPAPARPAPRPVAPVAAPVAPAPAPVAAVAPIATPSPVETQASALKLAAEEQARMVEKARADELQRQEEIRRRRGYGVSSFVTGGLRGLPTNLAQLLGI